MIRGRKIRPKPICIKPFNLLRKYRPSRRLAKPVPVTLVGGPLSGGRRQMRLFTDTLIIVVRGETGSYDVTGRWIPRHPDGRPLCDLSHTTGSFMV